MYPWYKTVQKGHFYVFFIVLFIISYRFVLFYNGFIVSFLPRLDKTIFIYRSKQYRPLIVFRRSLLGTSYLVKKLSVNRTRWVRAPNPECWIVFLLKRQNFTKKAEDLYLWPAFWCCVHLKAVSNTFLWFQDVFPKMHKTAI